AGIQVGRKRVARLMRAAGLVGVSRRKWLTTTVRDRDARPAPDLVERHFVAPGPNRLWVADITYIPTWAGFLYLAVVLDAFSRRIVGWAMETHLRTELVLEALNMALAQRRPAGPPAGSIIPTRAACTLRSPSACAAKRLGCGRRWVQPATAATMRCARAFSPPWNASCLTVATSKPS